MITTGAGDDIVIAARTAARDRSRPAHGDDIVRRRRDGRLARVGDARSHRPAPTIVAVTTVDAGRRRRHHDGSGDDVIDAGIWPEPRDSATAATISRRGDSGAIHTSAAAAAARARSRRSRRESAAATRSRPATARTSSSAAPNDIVTRGRRRSTSWSATTRRSPFLVHRARLSRRLAQQRDRPIETTDARHGGADTIYGEDGDDVLIGGAAGDRIDGGSQRDLIFGDNVPRSTARPTTPTLDEPALPRTLLGGRLPRTTRTALRLGGRQRCASANPDGTPAWTRLPRHAARPRPTATQDAAPRTTSATTTSPAAPTTTRSSASSATTRSRATARSTCRSTPARSARRAPATCGPARRSCRPSTAGDRRRRLHRGRRRRRRDLRQPRPGRHRRRQLRPLQPDDAGQRPATAPT